MEQIEFTGEGFDLNEELIIKNKEIITDFIGDNQDVYEALLSGGASWNKTSLVNMDMLEGEDENKTHEQIGRAPLDPKALEIKVKNISAFFKAKPEFRTRLFQYIDSQKQNEL